MAVNQNLVNEIIITGSANDPVVRLQNLEREIDQVKISIKRLLMDIRERMNELENPLIIAGPGSVKKNISQEIMTRQAALEARESALDARESNLETAKILPEVKPPAEKKTENYGQVFPVVAESHPLPDEKCPVPGNNQPDLSARAVIPPQPAQETLPLQDAFHLFSWTQMGVKKFGYNRLEILVESYRIMGYIRKKTADEIRQISCLMPENLGDEYEVGPDDFVFELYSLKRILSPGDTSLDRDMIEVIMEQRLQDPYSVNASTLLRIPETNRGRSVFEKRIANE